MKKIKRPLFMACIFVAAMAAVFVLTNESLDTWRGSPPGLYNGERVLVCARVKQKYGTKLFLDSVLLVQSAADSQDISDKQKDLDNYIKLEGLSVNYEEFTDENIPLTGQTIVLEGVFYFYSKATNQGEFDQYKYYRSIGIDGKIKGADIIKRSVDYSELKELLYEIGEGFSKRLYNVFPPKEASIMSMILLGDKEGIDSDIKDLYRRNGIIHILSISGLHITIIGMGIFKLLRRVGGMYEWLAAIISSAVLFLYLIMAGMPISGCRAVLMFAVRMFSHVAGRTYDMLTAMGLTLVIMLLCNPYYITNAGFLLSFGAIFGVEAVYGNLKTEKIEKNVILNSLFASMCISVTTLPVLLYFYYEIPVYAVLLNIVVLPLMSLLLVSGIIAMLVTGLGIVGTIDVAILFFYEKLCLVFEKLPFNTWNAGRPGLVQIVVYYTVLTVGVVLAKCFSSGIAKRHSGNKAEKNIMAVMAIIKKYVVLGYIILFLILVFIMGVGPKRKNEIIFLDVGQGDGIVVKTDGGGVYIFDCGSSNRSEVGKYVLKPYLKFNGIKRVDAVIVSHSDMDHCSGIIELLQYGDEWGIEVGNLFLPNVKGEDFGKIKEACASMERPPQIRYIGKGDMWKDGGMAFTCLHPDKETMLTDANEASACFLVEAEKINILLAADVEGEGEKELIDEIKRRGISGINVLKVAHHGSKYSTGGDFLKQIDAGAAVISCGRNNRYGHPHVDTLERLKSDGSEIFRTDEGGEILVRITDEGIEVEEYAR